MIFDTDIFIWTQRGNPRAARLIDNCPERFLALQTYLELLQCARRKEDHRYIKEFLKDFDFQVIPLTQNIGHRAAIYIEEYSLAHGIRAGDALIAATAVENNIKLYTGNHKHFKCIKDLEIQVFRP